MSLIEKEAEFLEEMRKAESSGDLSALESATASLALFYVATQRFLTAAPFWRRGADLLSKSTAPDSRELANYLHTMAIVCLIPAGLREEAHATLTRARGIYALHYLSSADVFREVDALLAENA